MADDEVLIAKNEDDDEIIVARKVNPGRDRTRPWAIALVAVFFVTYALMFIVRTGPHDTSKSPPAPIGAVEGPPPSQL